MGGSIYPCSGKSNNSDKLIPKPSDIFDNISKLGFLFKFSSLPTYVLSIPHCNANDSWDKPRSVLRLLIRFANSFNTSLAIFLMYVTMFL